LGQADLFYDKATGAFRAAASAPDPDDDIVARGYDEAAPF
jgi:hypothetical protein